MQCLGGKKEMKVYLDPKNSPIVGLEVQDKFRMRKLDSRIRGPQYRLQSTRILIP